MVPSFLGLVDPTPGSQVDGVVDIVSVTDDRSMGSWVPGDAEVEIWGRQLPLGRLSIYGMQISAVSDTYIKVTLAPDAWWAISQATDTILTPAILELCAGLGGMGMGAAFLGGRPSVSVDITELSCAQLRANHHGHVIQLDLMSPMAAKLIHQELPDQPVVAMMGFPCQPYSTQGAQAGMNDKRAHVFERGLQVIFQTQCQAAIFECVPAAGHEPAILMGLDTLAKAMNWKVHTVELQLADQWPSYRRRWWAILMPANWTLKEDLQWPKTTPYQTVGDILPGWGTWSEADEGALQLTEMELAAYLNPAHGDDPRLLRLTEKARTLLHSYGNALGGCPCQCRLYGFSATSLKQKGLRGFFVPSQATGQPRYLHPKEAALLLGLPQTVEYPHPPRSSLALIGLVASPLQACWVYNLLINGAANYVDGIHRIDPLDTLRSYQAHLIKEARDHFLMTSPTSCHEITLNGPDGADLIIISSTATTAGQLLQANRILLGWGETQQLFKDGRPLTRSTQLRANESFLLESGAKRQRREQPTGLLVIAIEHEGHLHVAYTEAGTFIFEVMAAQGINGIHYLLNDDGKIFGADYRLWRSLKLYTLPNDSFPRPLTIALEEGPLSACGKEDGHDPGLTEGTLNHYARHILRQPSTSTLTPVYLDPMLLYAGMQGNKEACNQIIHTCNQDGPTKLYCLFWACGHWALLVGDSIEATSPWRYYDGLKGHVASTARQLADFLSDTLHWTRKDLIQLSWVPQIDATTCGTIALAHLCLEHGLQGNFTPHTIQGLHRWLLRHGLPGMFLGRGPEWMAQLSALLKEKGVPATLAAERAQTVWDKLGAGAIINALSSQNPWKVLKTTAGKPQHQLRLVKADELTEYIKQRAPQRPGGQHIDAKHKKKTGARPVKSPLHVDTNQLEVYPDTFVDDKDVVLPNINFEQVGADARGVAICTPTQALHFIKGAASISTDALALALTELPDPDIIAMSNIKALTFPAKHQVTEEPILFHGGLLQLGDIEVSRAANTMVKADVLDTVILKVQVYRDLFQTPWEQFNQAPVREIVGQIPTLRLCPGRTCGADCPFSHCPVGQPLDGVITELWGRNYTNLEGRRQPDQEAHMFSVFMRIHTLFLKATLDIMVPGIFLEPRQPDQKGPSDEYAIIWLPGADYEQAQHLAKTFGRTSGLARMKQRYGIRVLIADQEAAFKALRPGTPFLDVKVQQIYQLYPVPHGTQKHAVGKVLEAWQWKAKALQPGRGTADAMAWLVGAETAPPSKVMQAFDRDILITENKTPKKDAPTQGPVIPKKTQQLLRADRPLQAGSKPTDPWQDPSKDPWARLKPVLANPAAPAGATGAQRIEQVAADLKAQVATTVQQHLTQHTASTASGDAVKQLSAQTDQRLQKLETTVTEIRAQNQSVQKWFQDIKTHSQQTDQAIQQLQQAVKQNQADLQQTHAAMHQSTQKLTNDLSAFATQFRADSETLWNDRFDRLEAQLSKKERRE